MNLTRYVPLDGALMAAGKAMDTLPEGDEAFREWFNTQPVRHGQIIDYPALHVSEVEDVLATVPDTPAGRAWREVVEESLATTLASAPRPYDLLTFDTPEELAAIAALDAFAESLREISPMLDEVADAVEMFAETGPTSLSDLRAERSRIGIDGFVVGSLESSCGKHQECLDAHERRTVRWEHIDAVAFGGRAHAMQTELSRLLVPLNDAIPDSEPSSVEEVTR